jgi:2-polyprenyl-3-methyl-5-hydroxy-6-metoxy-1,4-benzoquinol methylase
MSYKKAITEFLEIDLVSMRPRNFIENMNQAKLNWILKAKDKSGYVSQEVCPVCASSKRTLEITLVEGLRIYQCSNCTLAYVDPFPVNSSDIYEKTYFDKSLVSYDQMRSYRIQRFGVERINLIKKFIPSGKLLDIGCGVGWFLEAAKSEGFEIYGQEISSELADYTSESLGIKVFTEEISNIKQKFDVITMFDLIEHVMDPKKLILESKALLNPGGIIVAFTPNFDSLGIQLLRETSSLICPPAHLTYFTKKSVEKLAMDSGLELVHLETKGMDIGDIHAYFNHLGKTEAAEELAKLFPQLQAIVDKAGAANHMRFIYQNT